MKQIAIASLVAAQATTASADEWAFRVTPYVWLPSFETEVTFEDGEEAEASTSILEILDGAFLIFGEATRGRFSLIGEFNWLRLSDEIDTPGPLLDGDLILSGTMSSVRAGYAFVDQPGTRIEALAGLRYWDVTFEADLDRFDVPDVTEELLDPFVGVRARQTLSDRWEAAGTLTIGGGNDSDLQVDAIASAAYAFTPVTAGLIGYRHYEIDFKAESPAIRLRLSGPFVALQFRF